MPCKELLSIFQQKILLFVATSVFVVGCGTDTNTTPTFKQAFAYAHAVNLRAKDLPEMTSFANGFPIRRQIVSAGIERCSGIRDVRPTLSVNSPRFRALRSERPLKSEAVHSTVYFMESNATARQDVETIGSERFRACLERSEEIGAGYHRDFHGEAFRQKVKVALLPQPSLGFRTFGLRISDTVAATYAIAK